MRQRQSSIKATERSPGGRRRTMSINVYLMEGTDTGQWLQIIEKGMFLSLRDKCLNLLQLPGTFQRPDPHRRTVTRQQVLAPVGLLHQQN